MLDQLSVGVAQFDAKHRLAFANQPFHRIFALGTAAMVDPPSFEQWLAATRDLGRLPEVRDFPEWRRERAEWFNADAPQEEAWPLRDGTHLRIVAQPMPDGGLVLVAEDQTEQLALSAMRDTLLRTRTATFDSLFRSIAVFSPMGACNCGIAASWPTGAWSRNISIIIRRSALLERIAEQHAAAQAKAMGDVVRAATLEYSAYGRTLSDGRTLEFAGVPLPDGNGLLTVLDIWMQKAEDALRRTQCCAGRSGCGQDPLPGQYEL
ncbi:MAG: PAS-domain containing protein [Caenibius sp.]